MNRCIETNEIGTTKDHGNTYKFYLNSCSSTKFLCMATVLSFEFILGHAEAVCVELCRPTVVHCRGEPG
jgi:hypothetical protein